MASKTLTKRMRKPLAMTKGFTFDPIAHAYTLDGKPLHGVTSILKVINKPALIQWAANMACDYIVENSEVTTDTEEINRMITGYKVSLETLNEARRAHTKKKEAAGEAGSDVHARIEAHVKNAIKTYNGYIQGQNPATEPQLLLFVNWARENNVRFIESEKRVYSRESWYAGTLDLVLEMGGKKYIADVKTSSAIYPEFYLQMAAYQGALEEMGEHLDIAGAMVINLPKKGGFEIGMNYAYADNRMAFLAALILYKQLNAIK